jgi:hypothetical protein
MDELERSAAIVPERKGWRKQLRIGVFIVSLVVAGSLVGLSVGALLFTYLVPFWAHTVIDTENHRFTEIVFVDYYFFTNHDPSLDRVVLKTETGELYSFHRNEWQQIPPLPVTTGTIEFFGGVEHALFVLSDQGDIFMFKESEWHTGSDVHHHRIDYQPCDKWQSRPPVFRQIADTYGTEFARPISLTSRCYVLLADGTLHLWLRHINLFQMLLMGWGSNSKYRVSQIILGG